MFVVGVAEKVGKQRAGTQPPLSFGTATTTTTITTTTIIIGEESARTPCPLQDIRVSRLQIHALTAAVKKRFSVRIINQKRTRPNKCIAHSEKTALQNEEAKSWKSFLQCPFAIESTTCTTFNHVLLRWMILFRSLMCELHN